jgi:hypothetical protein
VETSRKIGAHVVVEDSRLRGVLRQELLVFALLARLDADKVEFEGAAAAEGGGSAVITLVVKEGVQVGWLAGWLTGWLAGWLAGCPAAAGWLGSWQLAAAGLAGPRRAAPTSAAAAAGGLAGAHPHGRPV